jgi:hypothetical protein
MSQKQQKEQQYGTNSSSKRPDPEGTSSPNVAFKDQVREARLPSSPLDTTAPGGEGAVAATIADSIPVVSAEAVS